MHDRHANHRITRPAGYLVETAEILRPAERACPEPIAAKIETEISVLGSAMNDERWAASLTADMNAAVPDTACTVYKAQRGQHGRRIATA
jgi:hypothetical protein